MNDPLFWAQLAYVACGCLRNANKESLRRFWIDDFLPDSALDTKRGVDFAGTGWVGEGPRLQQPYHFVVSVPQKMLHRPRPSFSIEQLKLDAAQQTLQIQILEERHVA